MKHFTYEKVKLVLGKTAFMNEVVAGRLFYCSTWGNVSVTYHINIVTINFTSHIHIRMKYCMGSIVCYT